MTPVATFFAIGHKIIRPGGNVNRPRLEKPAFHKAVAGDQHIFGVAHRHNIPPPFGHLIPVEMALEGARVATLGGMQVEAQIRGRFQPGHHAGNIIKIHSPARAQAMHDLLQPGGAGFTIGADDHIRGLQGKSEAEIASFICPHPLGARSHFSE